MNEQLDHLGRRDTGGQDIYKRLSSQYSVVYHIPKLFPSTLPLAVVYYTVQLYVNIT